MIMCISAVADESRYAHCFILSLLHIRVSHIRAKIARFTASSRLSFVIVFGAISAAFLKSALLIFCLQATSTYGYKIEPCQTPDIPPLCSSFRSIQLPQMLPAAFPQSSSPKASCSAPSPLFDAFILHENCYLCLFPPVTYVTTLYIIYPPEQGFVRRQPFQYRSCLRAHIQCAPTRRPKVPPLGQNLCRCGIVLDTGHGTR